MKRIFLVILFATALLFGCSPSESGGTGTDNTRALCTPGQQDVCDDCPNENMAGTRVCSEDGDWDECECVYVGGGDGDGERTHPHEGRNQLPPWGDVSGDGVPNKYDNCPYEYNPDQADTAGDGIGDVCDNCPNVANPDQAFSEDNPVDDRGMIMGDACAPGVIYVDAETDSSGDGWPDLLDNCPGLSNPDQIDSSGDGVGDLCDNCPDHYNPQQVSSPGNPTDERGIRMGDVCAPVPNNIPVCDDRSDAFKKLKPNIYVVLESSEAMGLAPDFVEPDPDDPDDPEPGDGDPDDGDPDPGDGDPDGDPDPEPEDDPTRLELAMDALDTITGELWNEARFGFTTFSFSTPEEVCDPTAPLEQVVTNMGTRNATELQSIYDGVEAEGHSPIYLAIRDIQENERYGIPTDLDDEQRPRVVLLITSGAPDCDPEFDEEEELPEVLDNVSIALEELYTEDGIPTYILSFPEDINEDVFAAFATAGGTETPFLSNLVEELIAEFRTLSDRVICSQPLVITPEDPEKIWVSIGGEYLDRDEYHYDEEENALVLAEHVCTELHEMDEADFSNLSTRIRMGCADSCVAEQPRGLCDLYYETCGAPYPCNSCSPEICDGQDNNCTGVIDDNCPECGIFRKECSSNSDCCSPFVCNSGTCGHECYPSGTACSSDGQCCSGDCQGAGGGSLGSCAAG